MQIMSDQVNEGVTAIAQFRCSEFDRHCTVGLSEAHARCLCILQHTDRKSRTSMASSFFHRPTLNNEKPFFTPSSRRAHPKASLPPASPPSN